MATNKKELYNLPPVEIYKIVLEGKIRKIFPAGFWLRPEAMDNAIEITKYLIEDYLKLSEEELKKQLSTKLFQDNKLGGMLNICFNGSPFDCINLAFPNKFYPWEFNIVSKGFWDDKENVINATRWLIEDKLKLTDEQLKKQLSVQMFYNNGLVGMLKTLKNSPYKAIELTYPGKFHPWEFNIVQNGYWENKDNIIMATKWLIEDKLKLSEDEIKEQLSSKLFEDNGLKGMLQAVNGSPYDAIELTYPNRFQPWDFNYVPMGFWDNKENIIKAVKWLIEDKLKLSDEQLKQQLSTRLFIDNGLKSMFEKCFNGSPYKAIELVYPGKFQPWEFNIVPHGFWDEKENRVKAIKWLIEDKLKLNKSELNSINTKTFKDNGLYGLLNSNFNNNITNAIQEYLEYYNL